VAHNKPDKRNSWDPHGNTGWYTGPAMEHYRCYEVYIPKTQAYRIADTVEFFPSTIPMPTLSSANAAQHAARDLIAALQNPHPAAPFHPIGDAQHVALKQLAEIFGTAAPRVPNPAAAPSVTKPAAPTPHAALATALPSQNAPLATLEEMFLAPELHGNMFNAFASAVIDPDSRKSMEYRELITNPKTRVHWNHSSANEFGRLTQGVGDRIKGTNTIQFIRKTEVPADKIVTYARFVCVLRRQKSEQERTRLTVGGNLIDYPDDTSAPTADITAFKCLVNSTLSTRNAKMCCANVKFFI
jgi:hypothetical protein